ncbi:hypothetical protein BJV74DRAFT_800212 [Russula compacta]|nr:hypothetical protein BJV74DRAFT_800212 [Russula compacta]
MVEKKKAQKEKATLEIEHQAQPTSTVTNSEVPLYDENSPADGNGGQLQSISDLADGDNGGAATDHASIDKPPKKKVKANKGSSVTSKDEGTGASGKGVGTRREAIEVMGKKLDAKWAQKHVFPLNLDLMLLLNHTTLFYFNLSNDQLAKDKYSGVVANWAKNVSHSQAKGRLTKSTTSKTLSLTSTARSAPTSAPTSVSSGKIKGHDSTSSNPQGNANDVATTFGGLEEEDEMTEWEAALSSPAKEGKRLTSAIIYFIPYFSATLMLPTIGHCED